MFQYTGVKCPVCQNELTEEDDIVVCPECGAPYHRGCYQKEGRCIMEDLHQSGQEWENPNLLKERSVSQPTALLCPHCGQPNDARAPMCEKCGLPLQRQTMLEEFPGIEAIPQDEESDEETSDDPKYEAYRQLYSAISIHDLIDGVPVKDLISFCQSNYLYFLRVFKMLSRRLNSLMFNWPAFFFNFIYFFYRKMYKTGAIILGVLTLSYLPSFILAYFLVPQVLENPVLLTTLAFDITGLEGLLAVAQVCSYVPMGLSLLSGFIANRQYYQHTMAHIAALRQQYGENEAAFQRALLAKGGASLQSVLFVILGILTAIFIASVTMAFVFLQP